MEGQKGLLLVVSGPSGVGKGTICRVLFERNPSVKFSVSATTRPMREGEVEGVSYFFKTHEEFEGMIERGEFLEYMKVFGSNYYGTPRKYVEQEVARGNDILLEIDVNGALSVKKEYPEAVTIFIAPPTYSALQDRLILRHTETEDVIARRLETAKSELKMMKEYDYIVVNDVLDTAVMIVESIITAEKARTPRNEELQQMLLGGIQND